MSHLPWSFKICTCLLQGSLQWFLTIEQITLFPFSFLFCRFSAEQTKMVSKPYNTCSVVHNLSRCMLVVGPALYLLCLRHSGRRTKGIFANVSSSEAPNFPLHAPKSTQLRVDLRIVSHKIKHLAVCRRRWLGSVYKCNVTYVNVCWGKIHILFAVISVSVPWRYVSVRKGWRLTLLLNRAISIFRKSEILSIMFLGCSDQTLDALHGPKKTHSIFLSHCPNIALTGKRTPTILGFSLCVKAAWHHIFIKEKFLRSCTWDLKYPCCNINVLVAPLRFCGDRCPVEKDIHICPRWNKVPKQVRRNCTSLGHGCIYRGPQSTNASTKQLLLRSS